MSVEFITGMSAFVSAVIIFIGSAFLLLMLVMGARLAYWVTASVTLASMGQPGNASPAYTFHADFWNTWDQRKLETEVSNAQLKHTFHRPDVVFKPDSQREARKVSLRSTDGSPAGVSRAADPFARQSAATQQ